MSTPWLETAARAPLAFSQVREDPLVDSALLAEQPRGARVLLIASGGETAAWLASEGHAGHLHLVDFNPAQLALAQLKLYLLRVAPPAERLALLGHTEKAGHVRWAQLSRHLAALQIPAETLGPLATLSALGPDHAGRYELLFAQLRRTLQPHSAALQAVLGLSDLAEQTRHTAPGSVLAGALSEALQATMPLEVLVRLFGAAATAGARMAFAEHFAERLRHVLRTLPAATNPYLWQMLRGQFPPGHAYPWLTAAPPAQWPGLTFTHGTVLSALQTAAPAAFEFIHLSNVLDWLSPAEAAETLAAAWAALSPRGVVLIRQLNSTLEIPQAAPQFHWRDETARRLHATDRSFFYRALHVGQKEATG